MNKQELTTAHQLGDMPAEEFKKYGYELIDWIAEYLTNIEKFPVMPNIKPGDIKIKLPKNPPAASESFSKIFSIQNQFVLLVHQQKKRALATNS